MAAQQQLGAEIGRIYSAESSDDLAIVPTDVQLEMFRYGRPKAARFDGVRWHVLSDQEMVKFREEQLRRQAPKLIENPTPEKTPLKLDLGCGQNPREGFDGVDYHSPKAKFAVDLCKFPYPWENESVAELHSSHFLEHIPWRDVEERDLLAPSKATIEQFVGQDMLFALMDECYRILVPGGLFYIAVPNARADGAWQDPTHRRPFNQNTFYYFVAEWRQQMKLDHYRIRAAFDLVALAPAGPQTPDIVDRSPEVLMKKFNTEWNAIWEWQVTLKKKIAPT